MVSLAYTQLLGVCCFLFFSSLQIYDKIKAADSQPLKEKYEEELKKEIKKLQRCRDQIKVSGARRCWVTCLHHTARLGNQERRSKDANFNLHLLTFC